MANPAELHQVTNNNGENFALEPTSESYGVSRREISINIDLLSYQEQEQLAELRQRTQDREASALLSGESLLERTGADLVEGVALSLDREARRALVNHFVTVTEQHAGSMSYQEREALSHGILDRIESATVDSIDPVAKGKLEFMDKLNKTKQAEIIKLQLEMAKLKLEVAGYVKTSQDSLDGLRATYQGDVDVLEDVDVADQTLKAALSPVLQFEDEDVEELHIQTAELEAMVANVGGEELSPARGTEIDAILASYLGRNALTHIKIA